MKPQVKYRQTATRKPAATKGRNFRTFLLMSQFEAQEIGARIKIARELAGLTQEHLAEMSSFSKRSLQDYEMGVTIPYRHFRELGRLLNKREEWFLYGDREAGEDQLRRIVREELGRLATELRSDDNYHEGGSNVHSDRRDTRPDDA